MSVICVFGDSIVWGAYDLELGGWVNRLKLYFDKCGDETDVYNLGVSGDNVADVLKRFDVEAQARTPDTIIFAIGINDSPHPSGPQGTDINTFQNEFEELLGKAQKLTKKILVFSLTNVDEESGDHGYRNNEIAKYNKIIESLATDRGLQFLDLFGTLAKEDFADGLHPNTSGHDKIFEKVRQVL